MPAASTLDELMFALALMSSLPGSSGVVARKLRQRGAGVRIAAWLPFGCPDHTQFTIDMKPASQFVHSHLMGQQRTSTYSCVYLSPSLPVSVSTRSIRIEDSGLEHGIALNRQRNEDVVILPKTLFNFHDSLIFKVGEDDVFKAMLHIILRYQNEILKRDTLLFFITNRFPIFLAKFRDPSEFKKSRYISFTPGNTGQQTAIRIEFTSLLSFDPPVVEFELPDFSAFNKSARWAGPPQTFTERPGSTETFVASRLQCNPHFMDWGDIDLLNVYDTGILPSSTYRVQMFHQDCSDFCNDPPSLTVKTSPPEFAKISGITRMFFL